MASKKRPDKTNKTYKGKSEETNMETFPVIALGASAGGLEALKQFFANIPDNPGMTFIVVMHLSPDHQSMLPEILQKETNLKVASVKDGETIEPDKVLVIPPNKEIGVYQHKIQLSEIIDKKLFFPIDSFFHSLAKNSGRQAAGIILSGTGTDGAKGIREIKAHEGLVIVQSKETAEYSGMPGSAISTGVVDLVMPPQEMPDKIVQFFSNSHVFISDEDHKSSKKDLKQEEYLDKIFHILNHQSIYDFSFYKKNTLQRRISRRMVLRKVDTYQDYIGYLQQDSEEIEALFKELLIGVTSFFRDPESFEMLKKKGLSHALEQVPEHSDFRVWVPGCSTGEEVYSLAIILHEHLEQTSKRVKLQLFGTDINNEAIEKARMGLYPASIAADVGNEFLEKYFNKEGEHFRIRKDIRDSVIFSVQNILQDPPFIKLNLLSCRNLLIYFDRETQKKLLPLFHYVLAPNGLLMLGSSETIGEFTRFFEPIGKKWKIFAKKDVPLNLLNKIDLPSEPSFPEMVHEQPAPKKQPQKQDFFQITRNAILKQFSPSAVLVDSTGIILHIEGKVGKYLEQSTGPPSLNILDLAQEGLRIELSAAFRMAKEKNQTITQKKIKIKTNGNTQAIDLHVVPQSQTEAATGQYLVVFEDRNELAATSASKTEENIESSRVAELERELQLNKESYQATVRELEDSNQRLKTTNEELQSSNEELQSTNEELKSSKEELQSLNEELQSLNSELQNKVEELSTSRDDMYNLLSSREIATIFVDNNMNVRRFTPEANKIVNLIQSDLGRPLEHVMTNLTYEGMIEDLRNVLQNLTPKEVEVQSKEGHWFSMRIIPYRTTDNRIDGAVLTFININEQKDYQIKLQSALREKEEAHELVREVFDMNIEAMLVLDIDGNMIIGNTTFSKLFGIEQNKIQGQKIDALGKEFLQQINLMQYLQNAIKKGENFITNSFELKKPEDSTRYTIQGRIILKNRENPYRILLNFICERKANKGKHHDKH
jgi:two-component system CheB/CheR fusion protein